VLLDAMLGQFRSATDMFGKWNAAVKTCVWPVLAGAEPPCCDRKVFAGRCLIVLRSAERMGQ
jgi:hypothetical protein